MSTAVNSIPQPDEKLDFKKILPVFVIILIDLLGLTIIIPMLALYAASFGANAVTIGFLGAVYPAAQVIGAPFLGRLSDRFGRKPVLILSQIGTLLGFLLLGFADALWMFFLARLIDGLSGANISTAQAVITDSTTDKTRTQGLGLVGAAFGIGFVFGPVISYVALSLSQNDYHAPAFIAAGFSFISILLTILLLKETLPKERRVNLNTRREISLSILFDTLKKPFVGFLLVVMFFQQLAFGMFQQMLSLFTLNRLGLNASGNAVIFVFVGIVVVAVQGYFIGRWSRKFGEKWLIRFGLIMLLAGLLLTALTPRVPVPWYSQASVAAELSGGRSMPGETPPMQSLAVDIPSDANKGLLGLGWILVAMIPAAIGGGVLQPSINSLLTRNVSVVDIGGTLGISAALLSAANAFAPVIGGVLFQRIYSGAPYLFGSLVAVVLVLISLRGLEKRAHQPE
ncbi:MAG TPA: MFS transporter [Anaerolineaceae bacterium]|nr:MFS transporter [Anaerolineaceae bacterium]